MSAAGVAGGSPRAGLLREVVRLPAYRRWSATTQLVRLPLFMSPLAFLLLATAATGNYRLGAVMITAATVTEVAAAAPVGRLLDRADTLRVLSWLLLAAGAVLALLTLAGALSWPGVLLVVLAVLSATLTAGAPAGLRKVLAATVPHRLLTPALAIDGVLDPAGRGAVVRERVAPPGRSADVDGTLRHLPPGGPAPLDTGRWQGERDLCASVPAAHRRPPDP